MAKTNDVQAMLREIINNLSAFKVEVFKRFDEVDKRFDKADKKIDGVEDRLTKRIDTLGRQLAYLEDDAPTREEFGKSFNLKKRQSPCHPFLNLGSDL